MPKKFTGVNSKAAAAKARKDEKAEAERARKQKEEDDLLWADDGDPAKKKKERREAAERKRNEQLEKKKERQKQLQEEEAVMGGKASAKGASGSATKLTRDEIARRLREQQELDAAERRKAEKRKNDDLGENDELQENLNRLTVTENEATNIDDAIQVLSRESPSTEKHPERRMKAAYESFEKERLPQLKVENPNLRLSQLKQMMRKEWLKHPSNPFNKNVAQYNMK